MGQHPAAAGRAGGRVSPCGAGAKSWCNQRQAAGGRRQKAGSAPGCARLEQRTHPLDATRGEPTQRTPGLLGLQWYRQGVRGCQRVRAGGERARSACMWRCREQGEGAPAASLPGASPSQASARSRRQHRELPSCTRQHRSSGWSAHDSRAFAPQRPAVEGGRGEAEDERWVGEACSPGVLPLP